MARLAPGAAVVDMVYGPRSTRLVQEVRARGGIAVDGREVLLHQALDQFHLMTGCELPETLAREILDLEDGGDAGRPSQPKETED